MFEAFSEFDFAVLNGIQSAVACPFMDYTMTAVTFLGGAVIWAIIGVVLLFFKKHRICGAYVISAVILSILVGEFLIKPMVMRERPFLVNDFPIIISPPSGSSFPSTHTFLSFAAAIVLFKYRRWAGLAGLGFAALTGFSRLYLYVHYPTDVITGAVLGSFMGIIVIVAGFLIKKLHNRSKKTA